MWRKREKCSYGKGNCRGSQAKGKNRKGQNRIKIKYKLKIEEK